MYLVSTVKMVSLSNLSLLQARSLAGLVPRSDSSLAEVHPMLADPYYQGYSLDTMTDPVLLIAHSLSLPAVILPNHSISDQGCWLIEPVCETTPPCCLSLVTTHLATGVSSCYKASSPALLTKN